MRLYVERVISPSVFTLKWANPKFRPIIANLLWWKGPKGVQTPYLEGPNPLFGHIPYDVRLENTPFCVQRWVKYPFLVQKWSKRGDFMVHRSRMQRSKDPLVLNHLLGVFQVGT